MNHIIVDEVNKNKKYKFVVEHPGELGAGIQPYFDEVTIYLDSGDPGGDPGEFEDFMRQCFAQWFDGANVDKTML